MSLDKIQSIPYGKEVIKIKNISLAFGGVKALTNVSFEVKKGEVFAIIGPNGAGKSSMLNVINGFYKPTSGQINFAGEDRKEMNTRIRCQEWHSQNIPKYCSIQRNEHIRQLDDWTSIKTKTKFFNASIIFWTCSKRRSLS